MGKHERKWKKPWNWIQTWPMRMQEWDGSSEATIGIGAARMQLTSTRCNSIRPIRMRSLAQHCWQQHLAASMKASNCFGEPSNWTRCELLRMSIWELSTTPPGGCKNQKHPSGKLWKSILSMHTRTYFSV